MGPLHSVTISISISIAGGKLTVQDSVGDEPLGIGLSVSLLMLTDKGLGTEGNNNYAKPEIIFFLLLTLNHTWSMCWIACEVGSIHSHRAKIVTVQDTRNWVCPEHKALISWYQFISMVEVVFLFNTASFPVESVAWENVALWNIYCGWDTIYRYQSTAAYWNYL